MPRTTARQPELTFLCPACRHRILRAVCNGEEVELDTQRTTYTVNGRTTEDGRLCVVESRSYVLHQQVCPIDEGGFRA